MTEAALKERFTALMERLHIGRPRAEKAFDRLVEGYRHPVRHFHDIGHVADVLSHLDWAAEHVANIKALPADDRQVFLDSIELAIWYHDIVYDAKSHDNEAESARFMVTEAERLGIDPATVREAAQAILITADHANAKTLAEQIIADCDLHTLGVSWPQFEKNSQLIAAEYAHVPPDAFIEGRRQFMAAILAKGPIYKTKAFADRYERQARDNIEKLQKLPAQNLPQKPGAPAP